MNPQANSLSKWAQLKKLDSLHCLSDEEAPTSRGTRKLSVSEVSEYSQALNLERESSLSYTALGETGFDTLAQKANRQRRKLLLTANFDDWEQNQPHPHYKRAIKHFSLERCSVLEITDHRILNSTIGKLRKISEQNLSAIYEDLREVYSSLTLDRKKIIKSFAHLILIFQTSITFDLKCLRCKTLLNELTRLETRFFRRSSTRKDRDPKLLNHLSSIEFESRSPDLNKTPDSPYQKPKNGSTPPKTLSRSATMVVSNLKLIKKLFYRARYAFCSIGRFLKYDSKVNPIFNKYADLIHMITGNFEVKSKNFIKDSFQDEGKATMSSLGEIQDFEHNLMNYDYNRAIYSFLDNFLNKIEEADPKTLAHKQNELKGYLVSKKREWIAKIEKMKVHIKKKEIDSKMTHEMKEERVNCKICGNQVPMLFIVEHSKNCMEKMELKKKIRDLNKLINDDIFEAVKLYRELHTKNVVARREFQRVKKKLIKMLQEGSVQAKMTTSSQKAQSKGKRQSRDYSELERAFHESNKPMMTQSLSISITENQSDPLVEIISKSQSQKNLKAKKGYSKLHKAKTTLFEDETKGEDLAQKEQQLIEQAVEKLLEDSQLSKDAATSDSPDRIGLDEFLLKHNHSTPIDDTDKRTDVPAFSQKAKTKTKKHKHLDSAINTGRNLGATTLSDTGKRSCSASDDLDYLDDLEIPDLSQEPVVQTRNSIRKKFIEEEAYNSCDESSTPRHCLKRENDTSDSFELLHNEVEGEEVKATQDDDSHATSTKQPRISFTKPKTEKYMQILRKSRFYSQKQLDVSLKPEEIPQNTLVKETAEINLKLKKGKLKEEKRRKHNHSMNSSFNKSPASTANAEESHKNDEQYQKQVKQKKVLQLEMELIKKRITENCIKMNLYEHIKELGKIVHSSEKFGKKIESWFSEKQKQIEDLIKVIPEGQTDATGDSFLKHLEDKKNVLKTFDEVQRRLDSFENPVIPRILQRTNGVVHVYRPDSSVSEISKITEDYHRNSQRNSPVTTGKKHRDDVRDNFVYGFTHSLNEECEITISNEKSDSIYSPFKVVMGLKKDTNAISLTTSGIKVDSSRSETQITGCEVVKTNTENSELVASPESNYAKCPSQNEFPEVNDLRVEQQSTIETINKSRDTVDAGQYSGKENDFLVGNLQENLVISPKIDAEVNREEISGIKTQEVEDDAIVKKNPSSVRMFDSDIRLLTRYPDYTQDLEIPVVDSSQTESKTQLEGSELEENVTDPEGKGAAQKISIFGRKARNANRAMTSLTVTSNREQKRRNSTNPSKNNPDFRKSLSGSTTEESEESKFTSSPLESRRLTRISSSSQLVVIPESEIYEEEPQADKRKISDADLGSVSKGYYSDSSIRYSSPGVAQEKNEDSIGIESFEFIKFISKGAFGRVWLVRRKATNDLYAMKIIDIAEKQNRKFQHLESLKNEKKIFHMLCGDFVVKAIFTFTHKHFICFVMELMIGGDFGDILMEYGRLEDWVAKFYVAEIVLAVEYLHSVGIVHRDLKPDNFLLDAKGHLKLTDFGLSDTGIQQKVEDAKSTAKPNSQSRIRETLKSLMSPLPELNVPGRSYRINYKCESIYNVQSFPETSGNEQTPRNKKTEIIDTTVPNRFSQGPELLKKAAMKETMNNLGTDRLNKSSINKSDADNRKSSKSNSNGTPEQGSRISIRKTLPITNRLIGTPDYMAPEIIKGVTIRHPSVDWWSVGVIMFELITGLPPFNADDVETIFENIINLRIPWEDIQIGEEEDYMKPDAADLIKKLLTLDHKKRITAAEIKKHPWFAGIDWTNIRKGDGPIIPQHTSESDTTNFRRMQNSKEENPFMIGHKESFSGDELTEFMKKLRSEDDSQFTMSRYDILDLANRDLYEILKQQKESKAKAELKSFKEKEKIHEHEANDFNSSFEIDERSMGTYSRRYTDFIIEEEDIVYQ